MQFSPFGVEITANHISRDEERGQRGRSRNRLQIANSFVQTDLCCRPTDPKPEDPREKKKHNEQRSKRSHSRYLSSTISAKAAQSRAMRSQAPWLCPFTWSQPRTQTSIYQGEELVAESTTEPQADRCSSTDGGSQGRQGTSGLCGMAAPFARFEQPACRRGGRSGGGDGRWRGHDPRSDSRAPRCHGACLRTDGGQVPRSRMHQQVARAGDEKVQGHSSSSWPRTGLQGLAEVGRTALTVVPHPLKASQPSGSCASSAFPIWKRSTQPPPQAQTFLSLNSSERFRLS